MRNLFRITTLVFVLLTHLFSFAQEKESQKVLSPYFVVKSSNPDTDRLPLKKTVATVNIVGVIADVTIKQIYKNEGRHPLEAIYTFPAPTNAAVYAMEMTIGKRKIIAKIEEKQQARKNYEAAKKQGKRASLLEQQRPNVFQMNVANIMPGDSISVSLKYTELLKPTDGIYQFIYPTVVGPRYADITQSKDTQNNYINTPYQHQGEASSYDFDIKINLNAGMPIQDISCKTHHVKTHFTSTQQAVVTLSPTENKGGNRDFVLSYQLSGAKIASGLMLYEHHDEKFFLMMVQPPKRIEKAAIPPREYIFINDVSGSMSGYPMDVSKKIMRNLVNNLRPQDRFNVLVFAGTSGWLANESLSATAENIDKAINFIDTQNGSGSTQIISALKKALSFPRKYENMSRSFVIVTDGYVNVEKEVFDLIKNNNNHANTFVFGIGSSVNRNLIEGIAHVGMGEPFIVLNKNEANEKAEKFRKYISNPVLTQLKADFVNFDVYDVEPVTIPDVFAERPIIIFGKYKGTPKGSIKLKGYTGNKIWRTKIDVSKVKPSSKNAALRYLWARKRIQMLDDYSQVSYGLGKDSITQLGLKYNLLTNYTSFVAIEETPVNSDSLITVKQPLPLPLNVSDAAVGYELKLDKVILNETVLDIDEISFYKNIVLEADFSKTTKTILKNYIEDTLMPQLNTCFESANNLDGIKISIDAKGNVKKVSINGHKLDKKTSSCFEKIIKKWDFSQYHLNKAWTIAIQF
ncbi:MAG: VIT domain-containing protein [Flavobacteriaceae bacterium]